MLRGPTAALVVLWLHRGSNRQHPRSRSSTVATGPSAALEDVRRSSRTGQPVRTGSAHGRTRGSALTQSTSIFPSSLAPTKLLASSSGLVGLKTSTDATATWGGFPVPRETTTPSRWTSAPLPCQTHTDGQTDRQGRPGNNCSPSRGGRLRFRR